MCIHTYNRSKIDKVMDCVTGNPTVIKMVIHYARIGGENVLRDILGPPLMEVLASEDLVLLTTPVDVYRAWINQMETCAYTHTTGLKLIRLWIL